MLSSYDEQNDKIYTRKPTLLIGHTELVEDIKFSHDCTMAASGSSDQVILWCLKTMKQLKSFKLFGLEVVCIHMAFSKCDTLLAQSGYSFYDPKSLINYQILIWDIKNFELNMPLYKLTGHTDTNIELIFADNFLASCSFDKSIRLWRNDQQIACYKHTNIFNSISISNDGLLITGCSEIEIYIWYVGKQSKLMSWVYSSDQQYQNNKVCFSNNSKIIFATNCQKDKIQIWNCYSGKPKLLRKTKWYCPQNCRVSSDSTILEISNPSKGEVHSIDISTWRLIQISSLGRKQSGFLNEYDSMTLSFNDLYIGVGGESGETYIFKR